MNHAVLAQVVSGIPAPTERAESAPSGEVAFEQMLQGQQEKETGAASIAAAHGVAPVTSEEVVAEASTAALRLSTAGEGNRSVDGFAGLLQEDVSEAEMVASFLEETSRLVEQVAQRATSEVFELELEEVSEQPTEGSAPLSPEDEVMPPAAEPSQILADAALRADAAGIVSESSGPTPEEQALLLRANERATADSAPQRTRDLASIAPRLIRSEVEVVSDEGAATSPEPEASDEPLLRNSAQRDSTAGGGEDARARSEESREQRGLVRSERESALFRDLLRAPESAERRFPHGPRAVLESPDLLTSPVHASSAGEAGNLLETPMPSGALGTGAARSLYESAALTRPAAVLPPEAVNEEVQWLITRGGGRVRLQLHPPELGPLDLQVRVRGATVEVRIITHEASAQALIGAQRELLGEALASRDLRLEQFDVSMASHSDEEDTTFEQASEQREGAEEQEEGYWQARAGRRPDRAAAATGRAFETSSLSLTGRAGVDLRV